MIYTILIFLYTCAVFLFVVIYMVILRLITTSVVEIHTERRRTQMSERKLVGTSEMFKKALAGKYAIGAYNVNNMEILKVGKIDKIMRMGIVFQILFITS